ncbi:Spore coat protein CotH [Hymenobacter roseosalivarius DSM 11622]|uniref:Spore coat protein CotH n=1 Tax=Hymenobacter roseosalivarius DSM 11622 TaxID=645990 RepID=A0A1W1VZZ8_9BACT|nr:CotH kinase family protein [Hymenobacter roseosalivarius]SMB98701.1 Spore coat protein CotH [Hymenobacter roseosalivarius DSM 11622]
MRKFFTTNNLIIIFIVIIITIVNAVAGVTLTVSPKFYHIDHKKGLILVNQNINEISIVGEGAISDIQLDRKYSFIESVPVLSTTNSYQVKSEESMYTLYFTQLPVVQIGAKKEIADSPSVYAGFSMSEITGVVTESAIGIEIRGSFSQTFPKNSYELNFLNDTVTAQSRDIRLLQMRTDNKWNLQAMYNEPLRIRSKVSNELWQNIHQIYYKDKEPEAKNGIDMVYVELFVNAEYKGVYTLSERVDRKQLKLKKYNNGIKGELYKGSEWGGAVTFTALPPFDNTSLTWGGFEYKHPEEETNWSSIYNFVDFVKNSPNEEFYRDYQKKFNLENAVDYFIFLNLSRAADNTGKNIYIAKYKTDDPYYYVPWDLDGVFGTDWQGWNINVTNDILSNGFYDRLMQDRSVNGFRAAVNRRWAELRATVVTEEFILAKFRNNYDYLLANNVYERERKTWRAFERDAEQLTYISTWLKNRLDYLDVAFGSSLIAPNVVLSTANNQINAAFQLYPNPTSDYLTITFDSMPFELIIQDMNGKVILTSALSGKLNKIAVHHLKRGMYMATVKSDKNIKTQKLLIN